MNKTLQNENDVLTEIGILEKELQSIELRKSEITKKLAELHKQQIKNVSILVTTLGRQVSDKTPTTLDEKIALFLKLFRCREEIYPRLWISRDGGKKGYSPVCYNEWTEGLCHKPKIKCADCSNRQFEPLDVKVVESHLRGHVTVGTYAIKEDCITGLCDPQRFFRTSRQTSFRYSGALS